MGPTPADAVWSTAAVDPDLAFDYWRDSICDAFVQLSARPRHRGAFRGAITHHALDDVELSTVDADAQRVDRTRELVRRSQEEYLLASIQIEGCGRVGQDGRIAALQPGAMAFYDSTRPYTLDFDGAFRQLVVQVPKSAIPSGRARGCTARALDGVGPARLVTDFFVGLARQQDVGHPVAGLAPHALGLLEFALGLAADGHAEPGDAALRERVRAVVARVALDPDATADRVAAACHISRRTLFRVLAAEGTTLTELVRHERVRRAKALLRGGPTPVAVVADRCGFAGPAQFHRAFRAVVGTSPAAWRDRDGTDRET
ncbi:AraC family transcriptional regulator [Actinomycetospora soli]|uniref:AraC family transcriptional regulator n=1 Tax=Actinomycetospora soli TaxID=2893887 RepID=UPI001E41001A|nr:AraC family transcriptional regulator [Actinomycetospora soli]MCD2186835.1 AraC family transcriptional regulator [Actinomycetospora soli]